MPLDPNDFALFAAARRFARSRPPGSPPAFTPRGERRRPGPQAHRWRVPLAAVVVAGLSGCATLHQVTALRRVEFALDRVSDVRIAGIRVDDRRGFSDLSASEVGRLAAAVANGRVPLDLVVHVGARNPADNHVAARLVDVDWTLFLEDREATRGSITESRLIPPGQSVDVPIAASLDVAGFVRGSARDLFDLALSLAGSGGSPKEVRLDLVPAIETSLGPIRYPSRITVRRTVGGR